MAAKPISVGIHGALGRMGTRLIHLIQDDPTLSLGGAVGRPDHPSLGADVGTLIGLPRLDVPLKASLSKPLDVVISFANPSASLTMAEACSELGTPLVIGTTGFEPNQKAALTQLAGRIPLLVAPNTSKAVNLLMRLVGEAARAIGDSSDIEIVERHHRLKKDAPSGTALRLAEIAAQAIGSDRLLHGRHGLVGERSRGEIGVHALRTGDNPGEHTVVFGLMGECLELSHRALNRDGFARGALDAAKFLADKAPGAYTMDDVLSRQG